MVTQMASVNTQWSLKHGEVMSPWVLPVTLYDPMLCSSSDVSRVVGNEIGLTTTPIECFHELISVVGT